MSRHRTKQLSILALLLVTLLVLNTGVPAFAGESRSGRQVLVGPNEIIPDDLYAAGEVVTVEGTVRGDLIVAATEIRVNGKVEGDVIAAGRIVSINGEVGDDARIAAFQIEIGERGSIGDDASIVGFGLNARPGSRIGGDLYAGARQAILDGTVVGAVNSGAEALRIGGQLNGNVNADVGRPDPQFGQLQDFLRFAPFPVIPPGLTVNETAAVSGTLRYRSEGEAVIAPGARVAEVQREAKPLPDNRRQIERERDRGLGWVILLWVIQQLRRLITLLVFAFLLTWLAPRLVPEAAARLRQRPWPSLGIGCAAEIAFFIALPILLVLIVVIGLLLGVLTLGGLQTAWIAAGVLLEGLAAVAFVVITSWVTKIVVAYLIGALLLERAGAGYKSTVWPLLLGIVLYVIVRAIPILGWLVGLAATLFGLGALVWLAYDRLWPWHRPGRAAPVGEAPIPPGPAVGPAAAAPLGTNAAAPPQGDVFVVTPEPVVTESSPSSETGRDEAETITVPAVEITGETPPDTTGPATPDAAAGQPTQEEPMSEHASTPPPGDWADEDTGISDRTDPLFDEEINAADVEAALDADLDRDVLPGASDEDLMLLDDMDDQSLVMTEDEDYAATDDEQMLTADELKPLGEEDRITPEETVPENQNDLLSQEDVLSLDELGEEEIAGQEDVLSDDQLDRLDDESDSADDENRP